MKRLPLPFFARLLRGGIEIDGSPGPYLCRAVRNAALNHRRRRVRKFELDERWLESPPGLDAAEEMHPWMRIPRERRTRGDGLRGKDDDVH